MVDILPLDRQVRRKKLIIVDRDDHVDFYRGLVACHEDNGLNIMIIILLVAIALVMGFFIAHFPEDDVYISPGVTTSQVLPVTWGYSKKDYLSMKEVSEVRFREIREGMLHREQEVKERTKNYGLESARKEYDEDAKKAKKNTPSEDPLIKVKDSGK